MINPVVYSWCMLAVQRHRHTVLQGQTLTPHEESPYHLGVGNAAKKPSMQRRFVSAELTRLIRVQLTSRRHVQHAYRS